MACPATRGWDQPDLANPSCATHASPEDAKLIVEHKSIDDEASVRAKMFDLIEEFLQDRDEARSLEAILDQYEQWEGQNR